MILQIKELEKPFQNLSYGIVASNMKSLEKRIIHPYEIIYERAKLINEILSGKIPWLRKTEELLKNFEQRLDKVGEIRGLYLNIREATGRTPSGYATEIRVIIPDSNRELEYKIYDAFRELLTVSEPLLFDLHIVKQRGRKVEEFMPKEFWRYEWMSNLTC